MNLEKNNNGFTLVELLVATGIFLVLVSIASGTFIQSLRSQGVINDFNSSMNNASFVIEEMSREIRTGSFRDIGNDGEFKELAFINTSGQTVSYKLNEVSASIERCEGGGKCAPLTDPAVTIELLHFIVKGSRPGGGDSLQPRVTIIVGVSGEKGFGKELKVNLQTTVSSRVPDI